MLLLVNNIKENVRDRKIRNAAATVKIAIAPAMQFVCFVRKVSISNLIGSSVATYFCSAVTDFCTPVWD